MNISLYENASALNGLQQQQNIIANNIAASHVSGYKKVAVSFEAIEGGELARSTHDRLRNNMPGSFPVLKNQVDFNEGELKETSNPMDMAIRGNGFFGLSINDGNIVYTRDGQFYVNSDGVLVNSMGTSLLMKQEHLSRLYQERANYLLIRKVNYFREANS